MTRSDILVPVNLEKYSREGVDFAATVSAQLPVNITLLYVVELNIFPSSCRVYEELSREYHQRLQNIAGCAFNGAPRLRVRIGKAHEEILAEAGESGSELIVMTVPKTPRPIWRFGLTTIERVLRAAPCMTLALSKSWKINAAQYRRMLLPSLSVPPQELVYQE